MGNGMLLIAGMKVQFKIYTDKKGVGAYDVVAEDEEAHIERLGDFINSKFTSDEFRGKVLQWSSLFGSCDSAIKDVLFIGECTHAFSVAAGRLCGMIPHAGHAESPPLCENEKVRWCSTELRWPQELERNLYIELASNLKTLRAAGVWCSDGVDGHALEKRINAESCPCSTFQTVFWMMPYVADKKRRPMDTVAPLMHQYIMNFVQNAGLLLAEGSSSGADVDKPAVAVVVTSSQLLNWELRKAVTLTNDRVLEPDVRWFDVSEFERHGYQSRFGDGRDRRVEKPAIHRTCDMVVVRWQHRGNLPEGKEDELASDVTDQEIRDHRRIVESLGSVRPGNGCTDSAVPSSSPVEEGHMDLAGCPGQTAGD